jgi:hypothetical protein
MVLHAPSWLRHFQAVLVPSLAVAGIASLVALLLLPPFTDAMPANGAAILVGAVSWPLLMLLLNGEPLPQPKFEAATIVLGEAIEFVVHRSEQGAAKALGEFWIRSLREFRLGTTIIPPVAIVFFSLILFKVVPESSLGFIFAGAAVLALLSPFLTLFMGKQLAARNARRLPQEKVRVSRHGIAIGEAPDALAWSNVVRVWDFKEHMTLVLTPTMAIQLPKADIPEAAWTIIAPSTPTAS